MHVGAHALRELRALAQQRQFREALRAALRVYRSPVSFIAAWLHWLGKSLLHRSALLAVLLLSMATAGTFSYHDKFREAQYRGLAAKYEDLQGELDQVHLDYEALAGARTKLSDEKQLIESQMVALVDQYNLYSENDSLDASIKKTLTAEIHRRWEPLHRRCDEISAKEAFAMPAIQRHRDELETKRIQLDQESKKHGLPPHVWRKLDWPDGISKPPDVDATAAPTSTLEPPKPFAFNELEPRLLRAAAQVTARCRAPAGAPTTGTVALKMHSSGVVTATMSSGPKDTEAELCVVALFAAISVVPSEGRSELTIIRNFRVQSER